MVARKFTFCASTATLIAPTDGLRSKRKCGTSARLRFGAWIIQDLVAAPVPRVLSELRLQRWLRSMRSEAKRPSRQLWFLLRALAQRPHCTLRPNDQSGV